MNIYRVIRQALDFRTAAGLLAAVIFGGITLSGCKEKDVPYVIDSEEIESYLKQSEDATNLFRATGLLKPGTYTLVSGGPTFTDSLISSTRHYDIWVSDTAWDLGSYGRVKVANAKVTDELVVRTVRRQGTDSVVNQRTRSLEREGVFWKLGDDAEPYVGWLLWGFIGGPVSGSAVTVQTIVGKYRLDTLLKFTDTTREGNRYYRIREGMPTTVPGDHLGVTLSSAPRLRPLISSVTDAGYFTSPVPPTDSGRFVTTVTLPTDYNRLFDVALIQFVNDSLGTASGTPIFIPYKILH
jgi:hypothetical protein